MKFTIQYVVYVIKQSVSPKMFTNERLFTIQAFTFTRVHCIWFGREITVIVRINTNLEHFEPTCVRGRPVIFGTFEQSSFSVRHYHSHSVAPRIAHRIHDELIQKI